MKWEDFEKIEYQKTLDRINKIGNWVEIEKEIFKIFPNAKKQYYDKELKIWVSSHQSPNH